MIVKKNTYNKPVWEIIRVVNTIKVEKQYIYNRSSEFSNIIDYNVHNYFKIIIIIMMLKCIYGLNMHEEYNKVMNKEKTEAYCSRCNIVKIWEYIV